MKALLWECPDCAFGFDRMHTDEDGGYSCPVCELAEVRERLRPVKCVEPGCCGITWGSHADYHNHLALRERIAADIGAMTLKQIGMGVSLFDAARDQAARIARGQS